MTSPAAPFTARTEALRILVESELRHDFATDLLDRALDDPRLSAPDRSLATAIVYGTVRHRGTLDRVVGAFSNIGMERMDVEMRWILRTAACQMLFMDKIPAYAILDEAAELAKRHGHHRAAAFSTGVLRALQRSLKKIEPDHVPVDAAPAPEEEDRWGRSLADALERRWPGVDLRRMLPVPGGRRALFDRDLWPEPAHDPVAWLSWALSHPGWLVKRWLARFGAAATLGILEAGNRHPEIAIRENPGKCTRAQLVERLRKENIEIDEAKLHISNTGPLAKLASFQDGWFTVQDDAAQRVAPLVAAKPGELVADLCAAPGGKSGQLAESGARVVASDADYRKVREMRATFERLGVRVDLAAADARRPPFKTAFDAALVDVPCSNTGVLSRRVEARWRLKEKEIEILHRIQRAILAAAVEIVKPGGRVVYSTCSLEEEENGGLVREAIREGNGLSLEEELLILPGAKWTCGGYAARIRRMRRGPGVDGKGQF
ncbi:MAG: hypothetical protein HYY18_13985 [Planctomycetes bacterium]|nr:hypothetical protein [Planctomycetota bacterium]